MKMRRNRGFTLIELMVTIAVLAVLVAMATPSFMNTVRKNQIQRDMRDFIATLQDARSDAILHKATKTVTVGSSGWIPSDDVQWNTAKKPGASVSFNFMGSVSSISTQECFILESIKDTSLKAVMLLDKNGSITYLKGESTCPA